MAKEAKMVAAKESRAILLSSVWDVLGRREVFMAAASDNSTHGRLNFCQVGVNFIYGLDSGSQHMDYLL